VTASISRPSGSGNLLEFAGFELDVARRRLLHEGAAVALQPKAFEVLAYLVAHRDRVVSRNELLDELWPDEFVTDASLSFSVKAIRRALGDDGRRQAFIRTVHGRGFGFVAEVREVAEVRQVAELRVVADARSAGQASRLGRLRESADRRVLLAAAQAELVGRGRELADLEADLAEALAGSVRAALLVGDAGMGKTRLAAELARAAERQGMVVAVGRSSPDGDPAFWPWVQVLREVMAGCSDAELPGLLAEGAADLARILPEAAALADPSGSASDSQSARLRLVDAIVATLARACSGRPLLVVLDDLHWADAATLVVLRHLLRTLHEGALVLVGTLRGTDVAEAGPLEELLAWLHRTRRCRRVELAPLTESESERLAAGLLGDGDVLELARAAEGNPYFVEELCRERREGAGASVPRGIRDLALARLRRLSSGGAELVRMAAVAGLEFDLETTAVAAGLGDDAALEAVEEAVAAGMVAELTAVPGRFKFRHALMRQACYDELGGLRRARMHRRLAEALDAVDAAGSAAAESAAADLAMRAHHWAEAAPAGAVTRAVAAAEAAAEAHLDTLAWEEAFRWYRRAVELLPSSAPWRRRYELVLAAAHSGWRAGAGDAARDLQFEAAELAERHGSAEDLARVAPRMATMAPVHAADRVALLEKAVAALEQKGSADFALRARVVAALAAAVYAREPERSQTLAEEALALAGRSGDERTLRRVSETVLVCLWGSHLLARRLSLAEGNTAWADAHADEVRQLTSRPWYVDALLEAGRLEAVREQAGVFAEAAGRSRLPVFEGLAATIASMLAQAGGELEVAESQASRAFELGRRTDAAGASMTYWAQIYYVRREQARLEEIEAGLAMFTVQASQLSWKWLQVHLAAHLGRREQTEALLDPMLAEGLAAAMPPPTHTIHVGSLFGMAEVAWLLGHAELGAEVSGLLAPFADQWAKVALAGVCLGSVRQALGAAALACGRNEEAITYLQASHAAHEASSATVPRLRDELLLGKALAALPGQHRRGRDMLERVAAEAGRLGLTDIARHAAVH
jgi:DNA-binding winged helix-turn-helix (wHTH) protein